jgi:hypothetical protein
VTGQGSGGWQTFGERTVYDDRWVRLGLVDVRAPNGERWEYHVVHLARIAVALLVDDADRVLMLWRYRFIPGQWGYELLGAGTLVAVLYHLASRPCGGPGSNRQPDGSRVACTTVVPGSQLAPFSLFSNSLDVLRTSAPIDEVRR